MAQNDTIIRLSCRGKDPIEGQDSQEPRFGCFASPAASGAFAGNFFLAENFHGFIFRECRFGTFSLEVDRVPAFGACEDDSVSIAHAHRITLNVIYGQFAAAKM